MKRVITFIVAVLFTASVFAQAPEKMSYQAVIRNSSDAVLTNRSVGMRISILHGSAIGAAVYVETHTPTTNANGLVSIEIGLGTIVSGDFSTIDWANDSYFIKTETDPTGGSNYTITGISQLLSVPYALHAKTAETVTGGITETDPSVPTGTQAGQIQYWSGTSWVTIAAGNEGHVLTLENGMPTWKTEVGDNFVINFMTGKIWMDRNLGATQVAKSSTDAAAYGDLYQWGRAADGHQIRTSGTISTLSISDTPGHGDFLTNTSPPYDWRNPKNDNLWQGASGTNNPCPRGYRLPTEAEWEAENTSWSSNNVAGAFASPLKLTVAGSRNRSTGALLDVGSFGFYWSSTVSGTSVRGLSMSSSFALIGNGFRASGFSIRCLKD